MQLNPGEKFTISRQLFDPSDADTNYVQAVVRNAMTDAVIKTVPLVDNGSRRFTKPIDVPADVSGQGFYITITTSVYSDSGYSSYNLNYGEEQNTYLVQARKSGLEGGGGSGADIDYKKIERIYRNIGENFLKEIKDYINEKCKPVSVVKDLMPAMEKLKYLCTKIDIMSKNKPEPTDLTPLIKATESIIKTLDLIPKKIPPVELRPVYEAITAFRDTCEKTFRLIVDSISDLPAKNKAELEEAFADLKESVESTKQHGFKLSLDKPEKLKKEDDGIDPRVKRLMQPKI